MTDVFTPTLETPWRILLCHKHPVSARLRFLVPENPKAGVVVPESLPPLCVVAEPDQQPNVQSHPATALNLLKQRMPNLDPEFEICSEYQLYLETSEGLMPVYLATLNGHNLCDTPEGMRWMELTQSIGMPWLDREILRRAYEVLVG